MHSRGNILNIVMLGTGQHRDTTKNILTSLADSLEVDAEQSVHLIDGPAGKHKSKEHLMLGTYNLACSYDPKTGKIFTKKTPKKSKTASELGGNVKGEGYEDAFIEARAIVNEMLMAGKSPLELNLFGFSRGADTMLRTANVLYALYGDAVKVNIFLIDNVPGKFRQASKKARIVPPNVKEYNVILMEGERRIEFEAQNRSHMVLQNPQTSIKYFIYRGNHGFATRFEADPTKDPRPIHDAPKLAWDEVARFGRKHHLRFNKNKVPDYVIAGGKSGARTYTQIEAKALTDTERLEAYTRMSISEKEYNDHVKKMSNYRSILATNHEFLNRKFDYVLHGDGCFQDREHILLFKQQYPAVFDYFFQQNIGNASQSAVKRELALINSNPELKRFMLERAEIDTTQDPAPKGPQGIFLDADKFYNTTNDLRRMWEGVVETVGAVVCDYDNSISTASAQKLQDKIHEIIIGPTTEYDKMIEIKSLLATEAITRQHKKGGEFAYKIATIADSFKLMDETLAERLARKMDEYIKRPAAAKLFHKNKQVGETKKAVLSAAQRCLRELANKSVGNDIKQIQVILNTLYAAAGEIRLTLSHPKEGKYETTLREYALQICNYAPIKHPSDADEKARAAIVNPIMDRFHQEIHNELGVLREPKLQSYIKAVRKFMDIANRMLASRADIVAVDKALTTCNNLQFRLQEFDKKLWVDNPDHDVIATQLIKLTDVQTKLESAKTELDTTKTYSPSAILSYSPRSEIVTVPPGAPPGQLDVEIARVLAQAAPAAQHLGGLSDTAPMNTTEDFVHDKARVNFTEVTTGVGLFAKSTTVKSVQLMRDSTYKLESYFDPAQLSRFGTKGFLEWALSEIDDFRHADPMNNKHVLIQGEYPEKYVRYAIAYCQMLKLPYTNIVNDKYEPTDDDLKKVRKEMNKPTRISADKKLREMNLELRRTPADVTAIPTTKIK